MIIFGPRFSKALCDGCKKLSSLGSPVAPEWILAMIALESAGTWDPEVLQARAKLVPAEDKPGNPDMRPEIAGQFGLRLSKGNGARGLFQVMPIVAKRPGKPPLMSLYSPTDPTIQLVDAVNSWYGQAVHGRFGGFQSRNSLYCANLAPARLIGGAYDDETILYSNNEEDKNLPNHVYWPRAYKDNARAFGIEPDDQRLPNYNKEQRLRMKHLAVGLDAAVKTSQTRYNAELEAAYVANANGG